MIGKGKCLSGGRESSLGGRSETATGRKKRDGIRGELRKERQGEGGSAKISEGSNQHSRKAFLE